MTEINKLINLYWVYNHSAVEMLSMIKTDHPSVTLEYIQYEIDKLDSELDAFITCFEVKIDD